MSFAENLKPARLAAKLRQADVADLATVSEKTVRNWESGFCEPHPLVQRGLLEILKDRAALVRSKKEGASHAA